MAIVGVALLPVIRWSVVWWNSLHQGQTISLFGKSQMDPSMMWPLIWMIIGTKLWFVGSLLARARADNLRRETGRVGRQIGRRGRAMAIASTSSVYAVDFASVLLAGHHIPKLQIPRHFPARRQTPHCTNPPLLATRTFRCRGTDPHHASHPDKRRLILILALLPGYCHGVDRHELQRNVATSIRRMKS